SVARTQSFISSAFVRLVLCAGQQRQCKGECLSTGRLAQKFVFQVAVITLIETASANTNSKVVGDAVFETEANGGGVKAPQIIGSAIECTETVGDDEFQSATGFRFNRMPIDETRTLKCLKCDIGLFALLFLQFFQQIFLRVHHRSGEEKQYHS